MHRRVQGIGMQYMYGCSMITQGTRGIYYIVYSTYKPVIILTHHPPLTHLHSFCTICTLGISRSRRFSRVSIVNKSVHGLYTYSICLVCVQYSISIGNIYVCNICLECVQDKYSKRVINVYTICYIAYLSILLFRHRAPIKEYMQVKLQTYALYLQYNMQ